MILLWHLSPQRKIWIGVSFNRQRRHLLLLRTNRIALVRSKFGTAFTLFLIARGHDKITDLSFNIPYLLPQRTALRPLTSHRRPLGVPRGRRNSLISTIRNEHCTRTRSSLLVRKGRNCLQRSDDSCGKKYRHATSAFVEKASDLCANQ
jgi:hypothetical protein